MAATPSVKVVKSFSYLGVTRQWSNRYHFNGGTPADTAHWNTLFDAITTAEKAIHTSQVTIVEALGYAAGSEVPVATKTYSLAGTGAWSGLPLAPGDAAVLLRWATTARTAKNHPIYLYNYFHGGRMNAAGGGDAVATAETSAIGTYAAAWISGFSDGTTSYVRSGPNGATATGYIVKPNFTHRDFPR